MKFLELENDALRKEYTKHMEDIKKKYPKRLYDVFVKSRRFHDYLIVGFSYRADTAFFKEKSDKLILELQNDIAGEGRFLKIEFDLIQYVKFDSNTLDRDLKKFNPVGYTDFNSVDKGIKKIEIGRLYYAEIGINEQNKFTFEFLSDEGFTLYIVFEKCKILENKLM